MMTSSISNINTYQFSSKDNLFIDTNVLLYAYGPMADPDDWRVKTYSGALSRIRKSGAKVYIDALIISEFINVCARLAYQQATSHHNTFKEYRNSSAYKPVAKDISIAIKRILTFATCVDTKTSQFKMASIMTEFALGKSDINDQFLIETIRKHGYSFITNDGDFSRSNLNILTENKTLLKNS